MIFIYLLLTGRIIYDHVLVRECGSRTNHTRGPARPLFTDAANPQYRGHRKEDTMKSRLLIRAVCVGAALLVPAGGLTVLGAGVASAGTTIQSTGTTATFGALGKVPLADIILCTLPSPGTCQSPIVTPTHKTIKTAQLKITKTGTKIGTALITGKALITWSTGPIFNKVEIKTLNVVIKAAVTTGFDGCKLLTFPTVIYSKTSNTKWDATTVSLSSVVITDTSAHGSCSKSSTLHTELSGSKLKSKLVLS